MFQHLRHIFANPNSASLVKNGLRLLSANVVAQAIGLVVYPILTRLYTPDDFGLLNLFLTIGGVLTILTTCEYQYAIVLPKEEEKARTIFHVGLRILLAAIVIIALSIPFSSVIGKVFKTPSLAHVYWMMPIYVGALGLWNLLNYYYNRRKAFNRIGGYQLSQSVLSTGGKLAFGYTPFTQVGMLISSVFAPILSILLNVKLAWKKHIIHLLVPSTKEERKSVAREYKKFPTYSLPRALINNLSGNMPALALTPFFGLTELGFFGMAITLSFRPVGIISQSIYQVLLQRTSELVNKRDKISVIIHGYIKKAALIVGIGFLGLYFVLPWLVDLLLGSGWDATATYIRYFLPWLFFSAIVAPICFLCDIFKKQKIGLLFEVLFFVVRLSALVIGIALHSMEIAVLGYSLGGCLVIIFQLAWLISLVRNYERTLE